jgi:protein involved in polysaccharide export with SLBB domain
MPKITNFIVRYRKITLAMVLAFVGLTACRDNPPVVYPTSVTFTEDEPPLATGDKISISILNDATEKSRGEYVLSSSGEIEIPYIGEVKAAGKLSAALKREIRDKLADGYLVNPVVSVSVLEINSRKISVSGQVTKNGTIKYIPNMTIVDAIAQSGGLTPMARANAVRVTRSDKDGKTNTYVLPFEMILEAKRPNFPMLPGDQVYIDTRVF